MRKSPYYLNTYIIVNFFVMTLGPVVILSVCHFLTFRKIRENTRMHNAISSHQVERLPDISGKVSFILKCKFVYKRFCELAPAIRENKEADFSQPNAEKYALQSMCIITLASLCSF